MLEIKNLTITIDKKRILDDVSLSLGNHQIIVLLGENGSGKTTLFESILDINKKKYFGDIIIDGINSKELSAKDIAKRVTFNFQIKPKSDQYVYELLTLARSPFKNLSSKLSKEEEDRIDYAIELTHIEELLSRRIDTLSGGERQMVYLAMSIIQNTEYIFFDEPNTYLDIENQHKLIHILEILKNEGHTLIISLHNIETAFHLADIIYIMKDGKIVGSILKEEYEEEQLIEEIFHVKKIILQNGEEKLFIFR